METFERIAADPVIIIVALLLIAYGIKELHSLIMWWKARGDEYHGSRTEKENFRQQVCDIACTSEAHTQTLQKISDSLDKINERLDHAEEERKGDMVASGRATLYHLYETLKDRDTITMSEYETFNSVATRYLKAGGNSVFKDKIIPEITQKPIDGE